MAFSGFRRKSRGWAFIRKHGWASNHALTITNAEESEPSELTNRCQALAHHRKHSIVHPSIEGLPDAPSNIGCSYGRPGRTNHCHSPDNTDSRSHFHSLFQNRRNRLPEVVPFPLAQLNTVDLDVVSPLTAASRWLGRGGCHGITPPNPCIG